MRSAPELDVSGTYREGQQVCRLQRGKSFSAQQYISESRASTICKHCGLGCPARLLSAHYSSGEALAGSNRSGVWSRMCLPVPHTSPAHELTGGFVVSVPPPAKYTAS